MRTRAILTVAATTAATLGGGLASAGSAAATTAPLMTKATPKPSASAPKAAPTPAVLAVENALEVADDWCVAPLQWTQPLSADVFPTRYDVCDGKHKDPDGIHVLSNMCLAPVSLAGALGTEPAADPPCSRKPADGPGFEVLRNVSVAGVQATF